MNDSTFNIESILNKYKCKQPDDYLILLPVLNESKEIIAYLRPITANYLTTIPDCVEFMSRWRVENPSISTGIFTVTHERTQRWLDKYIIENNNRIIFLLTSFSGQFLGHIGLASFDYKSKTAEIDSVLRGVKNCIPRMMEFAVAAMISWGKSVVGLENFILKVFSDNVHAVEFYKRCGFVPDHLIPMIKVNLPDEIKWEISDDPNLANAEKYYLQMNYIK